MKGKYCAFDTDYSLFNGCYIIKFSSSSYPVQEELRSDRQINSSGKMV